MKFSQFIEDTGLSFHHPITQEEWDRITDVELERTEEITFKTPSGKEVPFRKVKHGEWIEKRNCLNSIHYICSNCGDGFSLAKNSFCPDCGADMRDYQRAEEEREYCIAHEESYNDEDGSM